MEHAYQVSEDTSLTGEIKMLRSLIKDQLDGPADPYVISNLVQTLARTIYVNNRHNDTASSLEDALIDAAALVLNRQPLDEPD